MNGSQPVVRPMRAGDREAVIQILSTSDPWLRLGYTAADWRKRFDPLPLEAEAFIVDDGGAVAGLALLRREFLGGDYLAILAIAPSERGRGLGRVLLEHLERLVFSRAKNFFVCVSDFNVDARRFYLRCGYQVVGNLPDLLVAGSAEILLRKTTGPLR